MFKFCVFVLLMTYVVAEYEIKERVLSLIDNNGNCANFFTACLDQCKIDGTFSSFRSCGEIYTAGIYIAFNIPICKCQCKRKGKALPLIIKARKETAKFADNAFCQSMLIQHNSYRTLHNSPALILNNSLSVFAQEWAEYLAKNGLFEHRANLFSLNRGENIYYAYDSSLLLSGENAAVSWYSEIVDWDFLSNSPKSSNAVIGHFTQVSFSLLFLFIFLCYL